MELLGIESKRGVLGARRQIAREPLGPRGSKVGRIRGDVALSVLRERFLMERNRGLRDIVVYGFLLLLIKLLPQTHIKNVCKL